MGWLSRPPPPPSTSSPTFPSTLHSNAWPGVHLIICSQSRLTFTVDKLCLYLKILTFGKGQRNTKVVFWISISCSHFRVNEFSDSWVSGVQILLGQKDMRILDATKGKGWIDRLPLLRTTQESQVPTSVPSPTGAFSSASPFCNSCPFSRA